MMLYNDERQHQSLGYRTPRQIYQEGQGKNIVPTETGLSLFGVLKQADPALVDPGVTAQLECLLDEVLIGKQEMVGAIDAVCDVAQRIIGKLKEGTSGEGLPLLGSAVNRDAGGRPPTPAMKRFADSVARQKGIKPPAGYTKSGSICRTFLDRHAPKKAGDELSGETWLQTAKSGAGIVRRKDCAGEGARHSRRDQGQFGCRVRMDCIKPGNGAP